MALADALAKVLSIFIFAGITSCGEESATDRSSAQSGGRGDKAMAYDEAVTRLPQLMTDVRWRETPTQRRVKVSIGAKTKLAESLPDISKYPLVVDPAITGGEVVVEIFASTEKSGTGTDGWLVEVAEAFNARNNELGNGKSARVRVRKIASGTGYQYIASGKYRPDAYTPSNHLWIRMVEADGVRTTPIRESLVPNVAGIVMKSRVADQVERTYGDLTVPSVVDAVVQGQIVMGYTNPFASSTGLNFLVTVLSSFAGGDQAKMLSPEVVSAFEGFQRGVPFVALTTLQMRDSVTGGGALDAFVMEHQTYAKVQELQSGYEFIPFGVRHDNPLYALGDVTPEKLEVLTLLADFAAESKYRKLAGKYGFDSSVDHDDQFPMPAGDVVVQAQQLWKEKKDAGRPIAAVFLCDVSGSMQGSRISGVRKALKLGSEFITSTNSIGLVLFSDNVTIVLPIRTFDLNQKAAFLAAVEDMDSGGGTAMYDGVLVALNLLIEAKTQNPDVKPILFVLTDGQTRSGYEFEHVSDVIEGIGIPVYTIGYEADVTELKRLSSLVEAASLNSDEQEISFKIGSMLNAQM